MIEYQQQDNLKHSRITNNDKEEQLFWKNNLRFRCLKKFLLKNSQILSSSKSISEALLGIPCYSILSKYFTV